MSEETKEREYTVDDARQALARDRTQRLEACQQALQVILRRHGCALVASVSVTEDGRLVATAHLRAVD